MDLSALDLTLFQQAIISLASAAVGAALIDSGPIRRIRTAVETRLHLMRVKQIALADVYDARPNR